MKCFLYDSLDKTQVDKTLVFKQNDRKILCYYNKMYIFTSTISYKVNG